MNYKTYCEIIKKLNVVIDTSYAHMYDETKLIPLEEYTFNEVLKKKKKNNKQNLYCYVNGINYDNYNNIVKDDLLFHLSIGDDDNKKLEYYDIIADYIEQMRDL